MSAAAKADFADSNIANLGSKANHDLRHATATKEEAWKDAGKEVGVQVWRIEKFQVKPWPKAQYGQFFSGDAYIVLKTYKPDPKSAKIAYNVHFWLGASSSQDEQGVAAYKTVELDDFLGETPIEYREVQNYESDAFLSIFPHIILLDGGVASGFTHTEAAKYTARLLHLKGDKKYVKLTQVPLSVSSLDDSDVFILDNGLFIWQWNGKTANLAEKRKADAVLHSLVEERQGKPKYAVLDGAEKSPDFWKLLGVSSGDAPASISSAVAPAASTTKAETSVWKLSDASGTLQLTKQATDKKLLNSDDVFLVDTQLHLFVYVGKKASAQEKQNAINYATAYLKQQKGGRENNTPISRVVEGTASAEFDAAFAK